jgi:hypothetical protein
VFLCRLGHGLKLRVCEEGRKEGGDHDRGVGD